MLKSIWNTIKGLTGQSRRSNKDIILNIDSKILQDTDQIANELNKYFLSVVKDLLGMNQTNKL